MYVLQLCASTSNLYPKGRAGHDFKSIDFENQNYDL